MKIPFTKMQGLGNDFVVIDQSSRRIPDIEKKVRKLLDRRLGIGGDQLLIVESSDIAPFRMRIFNPDGSEVEMCGNGIRCFYKYLLVKGLTSKKELEIETIAGSRKVYLKGDMISVNMGEPIFEGENIPVKHSGEIFGFPLKLGNKTVEINCISMGNPHTVIFVDEGEDFPVNELGPLIETHDFFPKRTNVEFVKEISEGVIDMRVWERGVGETMACGTGSCASAVAYIRKKGIDRKDIKVRLRGGELNIVWDKQVFMTGSADTVFDGEISI